MTNEQIIEKIKIDLDCWVMLKELKISPSDLFKIYEILKKHLPKEKEENKAIELEPMYEWWLDEFAMARNIQRIADHLNK